MSYVTSRTGERFIFRRVSWPGLTEVGTYDQFTGGSVDYGAYTALKASGSFDYRGDAPDTTDLIRVYYTFADEDGNTHNDCLGTFLVGYDTTRYSPDGTTLLAGGTVTGYSTLKVLSDRLLGLPMAVAAGTDPIAAAVSIIQGESLPCNYPAGTSYTLTASHTFEPSDSLLTVVNWLLSNCSTQFQAAWPDAMGTVQVQPYREPTTRTPVWTFADNEQSIMLPEVDASNEWMEAPNVVRLYFEDESVAMWASAKNKSGSRASLASRGGRETTYYEQVDEVADLSALTALAVTRLKDRSSEIERVSLTHAYVPLSAGDAVAVRYADRTWTGTVQSMHIDLSPAAQTTTQLRRFVSAALTIETDSGKLWEVV